jgi:hypothetical protein
MARKEGSNKDVEDGARDDDDEEEPSVGVMLGRGCAWCIVNHFDIPVFFLSFIVLYLSVGRCCYCVLVVAIISGIMCVRFRIMNATLWSAILVLYLHKSWNLSFGDVKISWDRSS